MQVRFKPIALPEAFPPPQVEIEHRRTQCLLLYLPMSPKPVLRDDVIVVLKSMLQRHLPGCFSPGILGQ